MAGKIEDLTGQRFGKLVVITLARKVTDNRIVQWECRCDCGNVTFVRPNNIKRGLTKSCGCAKYAYWKKRRRLLIKASHSARKVNAFVLRLDSLLTKEK